MIYTVTLNPSLDHVVSLTSFVEGKTNRSTQDKIYIGGKGINVAIVLNNLSMECKAIGIVAGFTGTYLVNELTKMGINNDFVHSDSGITRINTKIKTDVETEINSKGPSYTKEDIDNFFKKLEEIKDGDFLILSGSVPSSMGDDIYKEIIQKLKTKNIKIIVDATSKLLTNTLNEKPFLIKPNKAELEDIFSVKINSEDDVIKYGKKLVDEGAENVIISLGKDGAIFVNKDECYKEKSPSGKLINSVGSGDSVVAGFIYGVNKFSNYEKAFKFSVASGSATAFSKKLATENEIYNLYNNM